MKKTEFRRAVKDIDRELRDMKPRMPLLPICPLKWVGYLANPSDDMRPDLLACDRGECRWWDDEVCAILGIAKSLYNISRT